MRNDLTIWEIRTAAEARQFLNPQDLVEVAKRAGVDLRSVQAAVAGRTRHCKANGLLIELGRIRQAEAQRQAQEIVKQVK